MTTKSTNTKENIEEKTEDLQQETSKKSKPEDGKIESSDQVEEEKNAETDKKEPETLTVEEQLRQDLDAQKDKYLRLFAEFENYKRRTSKERLELFKTASQELMQVMLPVLDDFDRALKEIKKSEDDSLIEGVELINNKFREALKSKGLEPMAVKQGDTFDADIHEAVTQIPAPEKSMKGKIVDVVEKGYTLGEKIIRYPKVVTGK
jgi:molecular chaperone GrpE